MQSRAKLVRVTPFDFIYCSRSSIADSPCNDRDRQERLALTNDDDDDESMGTVMFEVAVEWGRLHLLVIPRLSSCSRGVARGSVTSKSLTTV